MSFLEPAQRLGRDAERAFYDTHRNAPDDPGYRRFLARIAEPLMQRLSGSAEGLDYGCGPGPALAAMLAEGGHRVACYDPYYCPDAAVLARDYDFITCTEVAEHFHDPAAEFVRLAGLLRPGGWLAVMTCFQTDDARFANWHYRRDPTHVVFYREETFAWLAGHLGWHLEVPAKDVALLRRPLLA
ncbi:class I SAM-dependent methyltransferase [Pseudothauera nasutitermitis]|uniref:class I SAM-dependent methyltransferase n=1 Tax=Pseudothauera nasutitermitis TaxID=2565930 RepID=UPI0022AA5A4B|nr:class I SAM-dependent methyltransferase [Pseudothauera nasutitermitis]